MTAQQPRAVKLNPLDSVAVALTGLDLGEVIEVSGVDPKITCTAEIPAGHKVALADISEGQEVRKYGQIIGFASEPIKTGDHVHIHNLAMGDFARDYAPGKDAQPTAYVPQSEQATFSGFVREDGRVGTRNYVGLVASVNCSASVCHFIAERFKGEAMNRWPNVDGVVAFGHGMGCAMGIGTPNHRLLEATIGGFATNPNFGGALVLGLGCEVALVDEIFSHQKLIEGPRLKALDIQSLGGTEATIEAGVKVVEELLEVANRDTRKEVSAEHLVVGLECGGSDAYSGITANPALGAAADLIVAHGGTAVLAETTEIYGAEHLLTRRAISPEVAEKLVEKIKWWEEYTARNGMEINNNPSPGNKAGGLTTILEKSLGASAKGGSTNLVQVYDYAQLVGEKGFVFMDTPGYDMVSITGMIAGGANVVCFTTGRGTVCGSKPAPTIKLATNSEMYNRLARDMDVNCGRIVDGTATVQEVGREIFELILRVASGERSFSEGYGFGEHEFVPWNIGGTV